MPLLGNSAWERRKRQGHLQPSVRFEHTSVLLEDYGLGGGKGKSTSQRKYDHTKVQGRI